MAFFSEEREKLLDKVGWHILTELQQDARIPFSELGRRVGLSAPAVAERVRRMEEVGIIKGYHVALDYTAIGLPVRAVMSIRSYEGRKDRVMDLAQQSPEVMTCHKVTGTECFYMGVAVASVTHLEHLIERFSAHGHVTTALILSSPVEEQIICPPNDMPH